MLKNISCSRSGEPVLAPHRRGLGRPYTLAVRVDLVDPRRSKTGLDKYDDIFLFSPP